jgi:hypothetical protein
MPDLEELFTKYKNKYLFRFEDHIFAMENLGKSMNAQFVKLYECQFLKKVLDFSDFVKESLGFFDQNIGKFGKHDAFFNNFTFIWDAFIRRQLFDKAENLWDNALEIAYEWERKNPEKIKIHKGTPLYFWSITCILNNDLEKGFLLMHQALEEDKRTRGVQFPETPPSFFVTLDFDERNQAFKDKVVEIAEFIDNRFLHNYRLTRGGSLTLTEFKGKFLKNGNLQEVVFYFVFESFRLKRMLVEIKERFKKNTFSSLLQTNTIFNLCLIIDNVLKLKNPNTSQWRLWDHLIFLSCKGLLRFNGISGLGTAFKEKFKDTLEKLLGSNYFLDNGDQLNPIEEDFAIVYGFRNFAAHRIEHHPIIYQHFEEIISRILNVLFFSIEKLY